MHIKKFFNRYLFFSVVIAASYVVYKQSTYHTVHHAVPATRTIKTLYGSVDVSEPVILELLDSVPMKRLQHINQYGVMAFVRPEQKYTRYEHSLGVFYLLRHFGATLEEQVAGLLHDISHTAFSHIADFLHGTHKDKYSYQDKIFKEYLDKTGVLAILKKHGLERVADYGTKVEYKILKDNLPNLCADRLEYNLYGGLVEEWITPEEIRSLVAALRYQDGQWIFTTKEAAERFAKLSIDLSVQNWCSAENAVASTTLAAILKEGFAQGVVTEDDFHFSTDAIVWQKLRAADDATIKKLFKRLDALDSCYQAGTPEQHDLYFSGKFRGIDPLVFSADGKSVQRLSQVSHTFALYLKEQESTCREFYIQYKMPH